MTVYIWNLVIKIPERRFNWIMFKLNETNPFFLSHFFLFLALASYCSEPFYVSSMCDRLHCLCVGGSLSLIVDVSLRIASFWHTRVLLGATFFSLEAVGNSGLNAALARLAEFLRKDMVDC